MQSGNAPPVPEEDEELPTLSPSLPSGVVTPNTSSEPSTNDANLQNDEEVVPELEPISIDESMPQEQDGEHNQHISRDQQVSMFVG